MINYYIIEILLLYIQYVIHVKMYIYSKGFSVYAM